MEDDQGIRIAERRLPGYQDGCLAAVHCLIFWLPDIHYLVS